MRTAPNEPRTVAQNKRIYGLRLQLCQAGQEAEEVAQLVRTICAQVSGQEHTSQLTVGQCDALIRELEKALAEAQPRPRPTSALSRAQPSPHEPWGARREDRAAQPITERQLEVIDRLCQDAGFTSLPQRVGFFARQLEGRRAIRTQQDADKIIEPLKAIILRRVTLEEVQARFAAVAAHPELAKDAWLTGFVKDVSQRLKKEGKRGITPARLAKLVEAELRCGIQVPVAVARPEEASCAAG